MGGIWFPYDVQMSNLRGGEGVCETKNLAWRGHSGPKVDFPSSDQAFWTLFGIILEDFGD